MVRPISVRVPGGQAANRRGFPPRKPPVGLSLPSSICGTSRRCVSRCFFVAWSGGPAKVSARILAELERGAAPWIKPWSVLRGRVVPARAQCDQLRDRTQLVTKMVQAIAARPGGELVTEGELHSIISALARDLQSAVKHMDDTTIELDFASDSMGSRGRLRFRAYRLVEFYREAYYARAERATLGEARRWLH